MARQKFHIEGLAECEKALREFPKAVTVKAVLRRFLIEVAQPFIATAERLAPKLTGTLQASIDTGTKLTKRQKSQHHKQSAVEIFAGAGGLAQATQQEFGNANHGPQPFMRPAWDQHGKGMLDGMAAKLRTEIEKTRARIAKRAERRAAKMKSGN